MDMHKKDLEMEGKPVELDDCESPASTSPEDKVAEQPKPSLTSAVFWMTVNTLATVGIVFVNKSIFSDPSWKLCQLTFACFYFLVTWLTLFVLSRPRFGFFVPRHASWGQTVPLAVAMCFSVILSNLSLAFSSITFYQVARIMLTPVVAVMNFVLYRATLPSKAVLALIPSCVGVGIVSYYDSHPAAAAGIETTSPLGIVFALAGIFASSLNTVWVGSYHVTLRMNSMQLLYCQTPIASLLLLYGIPFIDTFPEWAAVPVSRWLMVLLSGAFASLINISQFFIVAQTGAVSSTVVGHLKTCAIVALGWKTSGRAASDKSVIGILMAIAGMILYSVCMMQRSERHRGGPGFTEEDAPNFIGSFYSMTKGHVEPILKSYNNCLILRLRMPVSDDLHPRNFVTKISSYERVVDIPNSNTLLHDLLPASIILAEHNEVGVYNFTNPGAISHEVLGLFRDIVRPGFTWHNFSLAEQAAVIKAGRSNCELETAKLVNKLKEYGYEVPEVHEAYRLCFGRMKAAGVK